MVELSTTVTKLASDASSVKRGVWSTVPSSWVVRCTCWDGSVLCVVFLVILYDSSGVLARDREGCSQERVIISNTGGGVEESKENNPPNATTSSCLITQDDDIVLETPRSKLSLIHI